MTSASKMERTRYLVIRYFYERILQEDEIRKIFSYQLNRLFGFKGSLEMGLYVAWVHPLEPKVILRTSHNNFLNLLCTTFFTTDFLDKPLLIVPIKSTGSIKNAKNIANLANESQPLK